MHVHVGSKSMLVTGYTVSAAHEALLTNPQKIIQQIMKAPDLNNVGEVCMYLWSCCASDGSSVEVLKYSLVVMMMMMVVL